MKNIQLTKPLLLPSFLLIRKKSFHGLTARFRTVFWDDLPVELPPIPAVDHAIELTENGEPPHRALFLFSPAELQSTREYVTELLRTGKIRPIRVSYGAPLFFVKHKDIIRIVMDFRALNRITNSNHAPIPRTDEMFDLLGRDTIFSKLELKAGVHQIRVREEDI